MKKSLLSLAFSLFVCMASAQEPYIATQGGDGLGQYGYLEKDAVTFARLERNTYNNIAYLSARWWISDNNTGNGNGKEYIYHVYAGPDWINGIGWQCGGDNYPSKRTTDYNVADFAPEWRAGTDCYVSVCAKYCDDSYSPSSFDGVSTYGAVGFNERHFRVLDVDTTAHISTASMISDAGGICQTTNPNNVAGSFTLEPAVFNGLSLTGLYLQNTGNALEGVDIPNSALHVYYEAATGTEVFGDGNEQYAGNLTGDWDGNGVDNVYGSSSLNIPVNGKIRVYILLCAFNSPAAVDKTINLRIVNDGIFMAPALDGFTKMRINASGISQRDIVLPVKFLSFTGHRRRGEVQLQWKLTTTETIDYFEIQQSMNGREFTAMATIPPNQAAAGSGSYQFSKPSTAAWFKVIAFDRSGRKYNSQVLYLKPLVQAIDVKAGTDRTSLLLIAEGITSSRYDMQLFDMAGRCMLQQPLRLVNGSNRVALPFSIAGQLIVVQLQNSLGERLSFTLLH